VPQRMPQDLAADAHRLEIHAHLRFIDVVDV
jgi:hypothetical protein